MTGQTIVTSFWYQKKIPLKVDAMILMYRVWYSEKRHTFLSNESNESNEYRNGFFLSTFTLTKVIRQSFNKDFDMYSRVLTPNSIFRFKPVPFYDFWGPWGRYLSGAPKIFFIKFSKLREIHWKQKDLNFFETAELYQSLIAFLKIFHEQFDTIFNDALTLHKEIDWRFKSWKHAQFLIKKAKIWEANA